MGFGQPKSIQNIKYTHKKPASQRKPASFRREREKEKTYDQPSKNDLSAVGDITHKLRMWLCSNAAELSVPKTTTGIFSVAMFFCEWHRRALFTQTN